MATTTLLVLADPAEPQLRMLDRFRAGMTIVTGQRTEVFAQSAPVADAILLWSASRELVQQVWAMAPRVRWIHSRAAGLDTDDLGDLGQKLRRCGLLPGMCRHLSGVGYHCCLLHH